ncbi:putative secreted protein [[Actinomadura] parvosata subsp. kistnae]|uniref:CehA/McbA family metallohydrolase n=1 Tax=[Actinomadura] parvosata TaxID=1955412 RepID=UPI000D27B435|nr:CehA/McbA family metallohydrolase [Nonomuraea sp. ATCC 55076]SPL97510.1 putative secreted protein [Actinomadura parvosata subsp. kistnae]
MDEERYKTKLSLDPDSGKGGRTVNGHWSLDDRLARSLREVPFEVPAGAAAVTVRLSYDRSQGVIDLGCAGPGGFRGWSGGARDTYTIGPAWATPGYLPGEPEPGTWHVWLRLHRIPPQGLDYTLDVSVHRTPPPEPVEAAEPPRGERPPRRAIPDLEGLRWYAGDFHAHTVHSDGSLTVAELAELARGRGLDFLAVTDHNTISHHPWLAGAGRDITLIPGQEVTTDRGHANVFGEVGWVDFREPADSWVEHAERAGGLISVNHPLGADCAWLLPITRRPRVAEVWSSGWWDRRWGAPLAWADAWRDDVIAIGGSDFHQHGSDGLPGTPTTWVLAEDPAAVLDGVRAGRTAVSTGPDGPLLLRLGDELIALDADGLVLVRPDGTRQVVRGERALLPAIDGPHRLETYENEVIALCA